MTGAFELPTPCHIIDLDILQKNLQRISRLKTEAGCKILLAVKGFSAPYLFEPMNGVLDGVSASGLYEARLGREFFGGYIQTYSPAYTESQIDDIIHFSDAVVFNSIQQLQTYGDAARAAGCSCGLRINPKYSRVDKDDVDPCKEYSHLGVAVEEITPKILEAVEGIHIHAMCEQQADALEDVLGHLTKLMGGLLKQIKWINIGGGQLIGHPNYDISRAAGCIRKLRENNNVEVILEPCEGILYGSGTFAAKVLDIVKNNAEIAILDASPICHMPDAVFRGWRREAIGEAKVSNEGYTYFLSGPTCFAGDIFGSYTFKKPLKIGDIVRFTDTATYTWVKNNAFNGVPFPTICTYSKDKGLQVVKQYNYAQFLDLL